MNKKELNKDELMSEILKAKSRLFIVGATVFDINWEALFKKRKEEKSLAQNFFNNAGDNNKRFIIKILRESENALAQFSLLTQNSDIDTYSSGNLNGVKNNILKIKDYLIVYADKNKIKPSERGLEPIEDIFKKDISSLYDKVARDYMLETINSFGCYSVLKETILSNINAGNAIDMKLSEIIISRTQNWKELQTNLTKITELKRAISEILTHLLNDKVNDEDCCLSDMGTWLTVGWLIDRVNEWLIIKKFDPKLVKEFAPEMLNVTSILYAIIQDAIMNIGDINNNKIVNEVAYRLKTDKKVAFDKADRERNLKLNEYKNNQETCQRLFIKDCYVPIPVSMILIDNDLYITHALTKFNSLNKFQFVGHLNDNVSEKAAENKNDNVVEKYESFWISEFRAYFAKYFNESDGAEKYATEITEKQDRMEVIDIFNGARVRIGTGPRDSFLSNMSIVKSVVWALIFDREGRILIHKRSANAKDNRNLWDKSVGGHVSVDDLDTIEAVRREITEELFTIEKEGQGGHNRVEWMVTNLNKIIYLGEWSTARYPDLNHLNLDSDEYYAFSLNYLDLNKNNFRKEIIVTERLLPNGEIVKAKCFADTYMCIVAKDFDIKKLQNSKFAMLTPNELKRCVNAKSVKLNERRHYDESVQAERFESTSDLFYLVNSSIWGDVVTEFARRVKENFKENKNEKK